MMGKRVLFLGGTFSDLLLIDELIKMEFSVYALNNMPNKEVNQRLDGFYYADYTERENVLRLAKDEGFIHVVSGANDSAYQTAVYVSEKLGLTGYDNIVTTKIIHEKDKFREFSEKIGLPTPRYYSIDKTSAKNFRVSEHKIGYPVIVKPVDSSGGKGISTVFESSGLASAINRALDYSLSERCIVEEFIQGSMHSYSSFLCDKKVIFDYYDSEYSWLNPYQIAYSSAPYFPSTDQKNYLKSIVEDIAGELELRDGLIHGQYLQQGHNIYIVEFTRRTPGDWYALPVEKLTGYKYTENTLKGYLGVPLAEMFHQQKAGNYIIRYCPMSQYNGELDTLKIDDSLEKSLIAQCTYIKKGELITDHLRQRLGVYIFQFESYMKMTKVLSNINQLFHCKIN